jgi:hypothetical protein
VPEDDCLLGCWDVIIVLIMEAGITSETSVNFYRTTENNLLYIFHLKN